MFLRVKYKLEASNYFFDNGELVFTLRIAIESLVFSNGIPLTGSVTELPGGMFLWEVMGHTVIYSIDGDILMVRVVVPD